MHIRQPIPSTLMLKRQPFVIDTQQVQQSSLEIVHMDRVFYDVVSEVVGLSIYGTGLYTGSRHPDGKASWMMVAAIVGISEFSL